MTVYGGTPKISLGQKRDTDYEAKRNAATAHAAYLDMGVSMGRDMVGSDGVGNSFMKAMQSHVYGNVNATEGDLSQGANSNFTARSDTYNAPLANPDRQTGTLDYATSSTNDPQTDPEGLDNSALAARIQRMAEGGSINLNPSSVYNI